MRVDIADIDDGEEAEDGEEDSESIPSMVKRGDMLAVEPRTRR